MSDEANAQMIDLGRIVVPLFKEELQARTVMERLTKVGAESADADPSKQGVALGRKSWPFDLNAVEKFAEGNEHHSTCIATKVEATVGLGFRRNQEAGGTDPAAEGYEISRVDTVLNPLCQTSWQDTIHDVCEDFWEKGNGYFEVVRRGNGRKITGLYHLPAREVFTYVENETGDFHYEIIGQENSITGSSNGTRRFCRWGDKERFLKEYYRDSGTSRPKEEDVSEVISLRSPTNKNRWYGFPRWLSALSAIELVQCQRQQKYDFFLNRGVPEFMLFILGQILSKAEWEKVENALKRTRGLSNQHKSLALNLGNPEIKIQLEKLGLEQTADRDFSDIGDTLAMAIVTAHRVPPLLAGIMIPGKLGAVNEMVNAMQAFQVLVIGPAQRLFMQTLGSTLGNADAGLGIGLTDFTFRTILDEINVGQADTVSRMRQSPAEAEAEGRDLDAGVKD